MLVSSVGDWLTQAACVTWIYESTRSVGLVSAFLATRMVGYALGGIISAPMLDRIPGFKALSVVETMRGGCTLAPDAYLFTVIDRAIVAEMAKLPKRR